MTMKHIWIYWHQGWDQAPSLVKECKSSWASLNPDYEIHALDQTSLFEHINFPAGIDIRRKDLTIQKVSALGRLALLLKYGGIWTDATVMCVRPLSAWLEEYYGSRFFAFRNPGKDRLMSNWFIAAESGNIILRRMYENFSDFYLNNNFVNQGTTLGDALLKTFSACWNKNVRTSPKWHSWFARKVLRIYPYFIFHYTFNKLIQDDQECAKLWYDAKPFSADAPHRLQVFEKSEDSISKAKREIDDCNTPMYKLDWRIDSSNSYFSFILSYLRRQS